VAMCPRGSGFVNTKTVAVCPARLVLNRVTICKYTILACNQPVGQLSVVPSVGWEISISQSAKMQCTCLVKSGMAYGSWQTELVDVDGR